MVAPEGLGWFGEHGRPEHLLLTNRHHDRQAWEPRRAFGCMVHCVRNGLHELEGRGPVEPFEFGDELPGGVVAYEVDAICADECALHAPVHRALACADGVVRWPADGPLRFVPDELMDDPERTKAGLARGIPPPARPRLRPSPARARRPDRPRREGRAVRVRRTRVVSRRRRARTGFALAVAARDLAHRRLIREGDDRAVGSGLEQSARLARATTRAESCAARRAAP